MSDTPEHEAHRRPHAPPTAGPFIEFDLPAEIHRLHAETTWSTGEALEESAFLLTLAWPGRG